MLAEVGPFPGCIVRRALVDGSVAQPIFLKAVGRCLQIVLQPGQAGGDRIEFLLVGCLPSPYQIVDIDLSECVGHERRPRGTVIGESDGDYSRSQLLPDPHSLPQGSQFGGILGL
ncbi:hypothetical protein EN933_37470 [Mesorhizobium sp. M7A.F.Ca.US.001.01.1.1]|nr:hypothetical protein EN933_37470 [Mesorhizobium sp. M7A.F.Ca.US.001.01.1.1]